MRFFIWVIWVEIQEVYLILDGILMMVLDFITISCVGENNSEVTQMKFKGRIPNVCLTY